LKDEVESFCRVAVVKGVALEDLRIFLFAPVTLHGHGGTGAGQPGADRGDGRHCAFAGVDATVIDFATQVKKGEPSRARAAPSRRLEVLSFVPIRESPPFSKMTRTVASLL